MKKLHLLRYNSFCLASLVLPCLLHKKSSAAQVRSVNSSHLAGLLHCLVTFKGQPCEAHTASVAALFVGWHVQPCNLTTSGKKGQQLLLCSFIGEILGKDSELATFAPCVSSAWTALSNGNWPGWMNGTVCVRHYLFPRNLMVECLQKVSWNKLIRNTAIATLFHIFWRLSTSFDNFLLLSTTHS